MSDTKKVSADDLRFAIQWLGAYEGEGDGGRTAVDCPDSDDEEVQTLRRVAAWVEAEVQRRETAALARELTTEYAKRTGRSARDPKVVAAARKVAARQKKKAGA